MFGEGIKISEQEVVENAPRKKGVVAAALGPDFITEVVTGAKKFDKRSFRVIRLGAKGKPVRGFSVIGCPAGQWDAAKGRCKVGTRAVKFWWPKAKMATLARSKRYKRVENPRRRRQTVSRRLLEQFAGRRLARNAPLLVIWNPPKKCVQCGLPARKGAYVRGSPVCNPCFAGVIGRGRTARNPRAMPPALRKYAKLPGFNAAVKKYVEIHGTYPTSVTRKTLPVAGKGRQFFVALGHAPAESYVPTASQERAGTSKKGKIWVHPYRGAPLKIVDASGKLILTAPGSHKVTDFIRG